MQTQPTRASDLAAHHPLLLTVVLRWTTCDHRLSNALETMHTEGPAAVHTTQHRLQHRPLIRPRTMHGAHLRLLAGTMTEAPMEAQELVKETSWTTVGEIRERITGHGLDTRVISNGNVRSQEDISSNMAFTKADGIMVGEAILGNPA